MERYLLNSGMVLTFDRQNLNYDLVSVSKRERSKSLVLKWFLEHYKNSQELAKMSSNGRAGKMPMSNYFFNQQMFLSFVDQNGLIFNVEDWMSLYNVLHQEAERGVSDRDFF